MNILTCTDSRFVIPTGIMLCSVCKNNSSCNLNIFIIIDNSVTEKQKDDVKSELCKFSNVKVEFLKVDVSDIQQYLIVKFEFFPVSIYYRLFLTDILPKEVDKILYLDGDIIVRHNLSELWETDIDKYAVGAVVNQSNSSKYWERLGYPKENGYFNSGVLLINTKYWREHNLKERFLKYIVENPQKLLYPDQDVLNFILKDEKKLLSVRYNVQEGFFRIEREQVDLINDEEVKLAVSDPYIIHYTYLKPWFRENRHPLCYIYYQYKKQTRWKNDMSKEDEHMSLIRFFIWYIRHLIKVFLGKEKNIYQNVKI